MKCSLTAFAGEGEPPRTWRVELLPWLGEQDLRSRYDNDSAWDAAVNRPVATTFVPFYRCPSNRRPQDEEGRFYSDYLLPTGAGTLFGERSVGPTIRGDHGWYVEHCRDCGKLWAAGGVDAAAGRRCSVRHASMSTAPGRPEGTSSSLLSSYHPAGGGLAYAAFADGAVRVISPRTTSEVLKALLSPRGDESVDIPSSW